jgi:hypothetical protein
MVEGKVAFALDVDIRDESGDSVVSMTIDWHFKKRLKNQQQAFVNNNDPV